MALTGCTENELQKAELDTFIPVSKLDEKKWDYVCGLGPYNSESTLYNFDNLYKEKIYNPKVHAKISSAVRGSHEDGFYLIFFKNSTLKINHYDENSFVLPKLLKNRISYMLKEQFVMAEDQCFPYSIAGFYKMKHPTRKNKIIYAFGRLNNGL